MGLLEIDGNIWVGDPRADGRRTISDMATGATIGILPKGVEDADIDGHPIVAMVREEKIEREDPAAAAQAARLARMREAAAEAAQNNDEEE